jgi:hypothetical protein
MKTAEEIFSVIDNQSVSRAIGVKLIEDFGIECSLKATEKMRQEQKEVEEILLRISAMMDSKLEGGESVRMENTGPKVGL